MPKYRYSEEIPKAKKPEKFFDFREIITRPVKWKSRTPSYLFEWTPQEIWEKEQKKCE